MVVPYIIPTPISRDITLNYTTTASLHVLSDLFYLRRH
jgi:hypothetical protein